VNIKYPAVQLEAFRLTADVVAKEARHLESTRRRLFGARIDEAWVKSLQDDEVLAERVEAFASRFGRLQDSLSLQLHHHRAEHWVVVRGTARITRGDEVITLSENQSTFIPLGVKHRLENPGKIGLELVEIQSGAYLGEDDIVRFDDHYGRNT
jgi:mannose-6-phosphate isomerase-like protein (cupin superfamily)